MLKGVFKSSIQRLHWAIKSKGPRKPQPSGDGMSKRPEDCFQGARCDHISTALRFISTVRDPCCGFVSPSGIYICAERRAAAQTSLQCCDAN